MSSITPYDEALQVIKQHPETGGAYSLAKLVLSLYNDLCGYSFAECVGNLDERLNGIAVRMIQNYAEHGETDELRAAGRLLADDFYPRLWEMGLAIRDARRATRAKWQAAERKAELDALEAAEAALFTEPAKLILAAKAKEILGQADSLYAYYNLAGSWRDTKLSSSTVYGAIDLLGGGELSYNYPEGGAMLAVRIAGQFYYIRTDDDAREAYLTSTRGPRKPIPLRLCIPLRASSAT